MGKTMALREDGEIYTLRAFPFFAMDIIKSCSRTFNTSSLRSIYLGRNSIVFEAVIAAEREGITGIADKEQGPSF